MLGGGGGAPPLPRGRALAQPPPPPPSPGVVSAVGRKPDSSGLAPRQAPATLSRVALRRLSPGPPPRHHSPETPGPRPSPGPTVTRPGPLNPQHFAGSV